MPGVSATCWKCGATQDEILLPLSRTEICAQCGTDLHVCRMCRFYDTSVSNACREPIAERVSDKTRANFCGYLEIRRDAATYAGAEEPQKINDDLQALFGLGQGESAASDTTQSLNDLFDLSKKN